MSCGSQAPPVRHIGARLEGERDEAVRRLAFEPGLSLRDILEGSSARVRSGCAGIGACGLCRVRIDAGAPGAASAAEVLHLGEEAIAAGTRLACQVTPAGDMDVTVLQPARPSQWRAPALRPYRAAHPLSSDVAGRGLPLGAAIDLGTTHITVALCEMASGRRLAARWGPNPQGRMGADVIGRLGAARSDLAARELRRSAAEAIGAALLHLSQGEGLDLAGVGRVRVVGNSAMMVLLCGMSPEALLDPAAWIRPIDCVLPDPAFLAGAWNLAPSASVEAVRPLGGFVGSDLLAGVIHCRLMEGPPALLVDIGTNSEIALWDGRRLWATAAAGGPAFEAIGISFGMGAEPGAVHRLSRSGDGAWSGETVESRPPLGVCGSGLVDLMAHLAAGGEIDERGRLRRQPLTVGVGNARFTVSKADVDALQRAKAAVAAGIELLCRRAGLPLSRLATLHVAGTFGERLDVASAVRIGLLPPVTGGQVLLAGNTALHGTLDLVLSGGAEAALARARSEARLVNLSMEEDFEELYLQHLHIRPFPAGS